LFILGQLCRFCVVRVVSFTFGVGFRVGVRVKLGYRFEYWCFKVFVWVWVVGISNG
jgi:hypothetical protein